MKLVRRLFLIGLVALCGLPPCACGERHPDTADRAARSVLEGPDGGSLPPGAARGKQPTGAAAKLRWEDLRGLDYEEGTVTPAMKAHDGTVVSVAGFIVPLDDGADEIGEFVLVPQPMMCIHVPPPPPNQLVHVKMVKPAPIQEIHEPFWVTGRLRIAKLRSEYGDASYEMAGESIVPYSR